MAVVREFQGKIIKRTMKVGDQIAIQFQAGEKGQLGERILVSITDYLVDRKASHEGKTREKC